MGDGADNRDPRKKCNVTPFRPAGLASVQRNRPRPRNRGLQVCVASLQLQCNLMIHERKTPSSMKRTRPGRVRWQGGRESRLIDGGRRDGHFHRCARRAHNLHRGHVRISAVRLRRENSNGKVKQQAPLVTVRSVSSVLSRSLTVSHGRLGDPRGGVAVEHVVSEGVVAAGVARGRRHAHGRRRGDRGRCKEGAFVHGRGEGGSLC